MRRAAGAHFEGIISGQTSITLGNLASINGRLLVETAVILDANMVTGPVRHEVERSQERKGQAIWFAAKLASQL